MEPNEKLKMYRKVSGLTLDEFSKELGCSNGALCRIEQGYRKPGRALAVTIEERTAPTIYRPDGTVASDKPIKVADWGE